MGICKIYLSGGMTALCEEEQTAWRRTFQNVFDVFDGNENTPVIFDPTQYYSLFYKEHKSDREAMEYDLYKLRNADLVIVNFNVPESIGTAMELMLAKEYHIPVIGLNENNVELHPWLKECCTRICDSFDELIDHVVGFYLN